MTDENIAEMNRRYAIKEELERERMKIPHEHYWEVASSGYGTETTLDLLICRSCGTTKEVERIITRSS